MRKLGVGVLGVGEMGRRHAENIRRLVPEARLVAGADAHGVKGRRGGGGHGRCATPDKFHANAIHTAAAAHKNILCEKPLATNPADAHAALAEVASNGVSLQIGFMRRYDPAYAAAMKRVEAGEIGETVIFKAVGGAQPR